MFHPTISPNRVGILACLLTATLLTTLAPSPARAGAERFEADVPAGPLFLPCLGEAIQGVFNLSVTTHVREDAKGGFHATENIQIGGLFVGLTSGIEWTAHGANNFKVNTQGDQVALTAVETISLVAHGGITNILTKFHETLVVNANGVVSRSFSAASFECKGEGGD